MSQSHVEALAAIVARLTLLAESDEQLRGQLRSVAQFILDATSPASEAAAALPAIAADQLEVVPPELAEPAPDVTSVVVPGTLNPETPSSLPLPRLTLGQTVPSVETTSIAPPVRWTTPTDSDFPVIEARCRLKAEGSRWAAKRRRLIAEGAYFSTEIDPFDRDIISRAKALPECFLWMCHPSGPTPSDLEQFDVAAACFENLADALSVVKQVLDDPELHQNQFEPALDLLSETQSALRVSVAELGAQFDSDQLRVYNWLRDTAAENRMFIQRYMRLDDPADPRSWSNLAARIDALDATLQEAQQRTKNRRRLLGKVRHKSSLIARDPEHAAEHWRLLIATVDELVSGGLPPSNRDLRDLLLPVIEDLPEMEELPKNFELVLREIDRVIAASSHAAECGAVRSPPSPQVQTVAELVGGQSMVLIGGDRRPAAHQAIVAAFGLQELIWLEAREHQSIVGFEPYIARPDVAVVLLAIRWSSHSYGEVREFCDNNGKPLVRLPTGYNPSQIAAQILGQCSDRLRASHV